MATHTGSDNFRRGYNAFSSRADISEAVGDIVKRMVTVELQLPPGTSPDQRTQAKFDKMCDWLKPRIESMVMNRPPPDPSTFPLRGREQYLADFTYQRFCERALVLRALDAIYEDPHDPAVSKVLRRTIGIKRLFSEPSDILGTPPYPPDYFYGFKRFNEHMQCCMPLGEEEKGAIMKVANRIKDFSRYRCHFEEFFKALDDLKYLHFHGRMR
ncbi:hypothetical protein V8F20_009694 [Naviculisporaceae sp. PSN 640]